MRFVLATGNRHKLAEYRAILAPHRVEPMPAGLELPPEGTVSFEANARANPEALARALAATAVPWGGTAAGGEPGAVASGAAASGDWPSNDLTIAIADDSGIEVASLGGAPGVVSSRYAGIEGDDARNNARLLAELAGRAGDSARAARFVCVIAYAVLPGPGVAEGAQRTSGSRPVADVAAVRGEWPGHIALEPRGEGGFGYDPLFVPDGLDRTVAQMGEPDKNAQSHRARAARALLARLRQESLG